MNKRKTLLLILSIVVISTIGCSTFKRQAVEGDSMVAVVVDGSHADDVFPMISTAIGKPLYTPQPEQLFYPLRFPEDSLGVVSKWANVLLVGCLDSDDNSSQRIKRMLDDNAEEMVAAGEMHIFTQNDVWVTKQTVVIVVAPTKSDLSAWLLENGSVLLKKFDEARTTRVKKQLYAVLEQTELSDSLQQNYGWYLRIPHDYQIVKTSSSPNYVRLRRWYPDRFVTVAWRLGDIEEVNIDSFLEWRDELGGMYADSSRVNPVILESKMVRVGDYNALKVHGIWETINSIGGGPFVSFLLHKDDTLYLVDGKVYAPDRAKEPHIRQLEIIFDSFIP
jgi:Domain of unknown function (DUF4837)